MRRRNGSCKVNDGVQCVGAGAAKTALLVASSCEEIPIRKRILATANSASTWPKSYATERAVGQHSGDHPMHTTNTSPIVSRRAALAGLGAGTLAVVLATTAGPLLAQEAN